MPKVHLSSVLIMLFCICPEKPQSRAYDKGRWGTVCRGQTEHGSTMLSRRGSMWRQDFLFLRLVSGTSFIPRLVGWLVCLFIYLMHLSLVKNHGDVPKAAPPGSAGIHPGRRICRLGGSSSIFQYINKYNKKSHYILSDAIIISEEESSNVR